MIGSGEARKERSRPRRVWAAALVASAGVGGGWPVLGLHSTTHLPASRARLGAAIDWTWTFTLTPTGEGGTRLLLRVRGQTRPWWLTAAYLAALVPADYVMARSMLAGISLRVQAVR